MNNLALLVALALSPAADSAGKATYDLVRYTPPAPWKTTAWIQDIKKDEHSTSYTVTDAKTRTYCQIFILRSRPSKGSLTADFETEWKDIVVSNYRVAEPPVLTDTAAEAGWQVKAGVATFAFDGGTSIAMLTTLSGYGRAVSIVAVTSSQDYLTAIQALLESVEMLKPAENASGTAKPPSKGTAKPAALQGYMDYSPFTKTWTWKVRYPPK